MICESEIEYKRYLMENGADPKFCRRLESPDRIYEFKDFKIETYGQWQRVPWAKQAMQYLKIIRNQETMKAGRKIVKEDISAKSE